MVDSARAKVLTKLEAFGCAEISVYEQGFVQSSSGQVGLQGKVVQLVADGDSTCALTEAGDVYCWGAGAPRRSAPAHNPLLLITVGALLVAGGTTLLMLSRP